MIKNIIFDWSGVINDNAFLVYKVVLEMFRRSGVPEISLEEFRREWKQPYMLFYNKYLPDATLEEEQKLYKEVYRDLVSRYPAKPFPGIIESLKKFHEKKIRMVILTSDHKETIFKEMKEFGVEEFFEDLIYGIHDKEEGIGDLMERNGLDEKETIFIGDTCHEVETGKKAGTVTAVVTWGFDSEDKLKSVNPDYIIHNIDELEDIIL